MEDYREIGKVRLNYKYYNGKDYYSDGDVAEQEMLEISQKGNWDEVLRKSDKWHILYHFSDIRKNILEWYPFDQKGTLLEIGSGCGALSGLFSEKCERVVAIELSERRSMINAYRNSECDNLEIVVGNFKDIEFREKYDYVTLIGVLEYAASYMGQEEPYSALLKKAQSLLKPNGKIFIAIENKMGMKYLNGAKEDHVGESYAGIEDYIYKKVRTFSKPELEKLLEESGIESFSFYYPYPDYKLPETIYTDLCIPQLGDVRLWDKNYDMPRVALYNDAIMADQICRDSMFDYFSNSFLVVTGEDTPRVGLSHYTNIRKREYQTKTIINNARTQVEKTYLKKSDRKYDIFSEMKDKYELLDKEFTNVHFLKPVVEENRLRYEYVEGESLESYLYKFRHTPDRMVEELIRIWKEYYACSEEYLTDFYITPEYTAMFGNSVISGATKSYKLSNLDMLLHNLIISDDEVYCIDYEWIVDFPIPMDFTLFRMARDYWEKYNMYFSRRYSRDAFLKAVGIKECDLQTYYKMYRDFSSYVFGKTKYIENYKKSKGTLRIQGL